MVEVLHNGLAPKLLSYAATVSHALGLCQKQGRRAHDENVHHMVTSSSLWWHSGGGYHHLPCSGTVEEDVIIFAAVAL